MLFADISNFYNFGDLAAIGNSAIFVENCILGLSVHGIIGSERLTEWYNRFGHEAMFTEVLLIILGICTARFIYKYLFNEFSIIYFVLVVLAVQFIHDIGFYIFLAIIPVGFSPMFDIFRSYIKEVGPRALLGNAFVITTTTLMASYSAMFSPALNVYSLLVSIYIAIYII